METTMRESGGSWRETNYGRGQDSRYDVSARVLQRHHHPLLVFAVTSVEPSGVRSLTWSRPSLSPGARMMGGMALWPVRVLPRILSMHNQLSNHAFAPSTQRSPDADPVISCSKGTAGWARQRAAQKTVSWWQACKAGSAHVAHHDTDTLPPIQQTKCARVLMTERC